MILTLDHINIVTPRLAETRDFYVEVLGLSEGARPPFEVAGHWLYVGDRALVHLQQAARPVGPSSDCALNHFAMTVDDLGPIEAALERLGVEHRLTTVPGTSIRQLFLLDPNGVRVELSCAQ